MPEVETAADWRSTLDRYLAAGGRPAQPARSTPLALQAQLRELVPRTQHRWNGPTSRAAGRRRGDEPGSGEHRLGVRPVTRTARGWARGALTWSNLPHQLHRLELEPAQHAWFGSFAALHRAGAPPTVGQDPDWLFLDEFGNPVLWALLEQAEGEGIPLVGAGGTVVAVGAAASLRLDVAGDGDGLRVRPVLAVDGMPAAQARARPIGSHGVYLFDLPEPRSIVLAPLDEPLDAERRAVLTSIGTEAGDTRVPADATDDFLRDYLPGLRDHLDVDSSDPAVRLPPPPPPVLVLTAEFRPGAMLDLAWHWERRRRAAEQPEVRHLLPAGLLPEAWLDRDGDVPGGASLADVA